ncbi:MAG: TetR/AcrR family transcriptional regulator [Actinomycetota bacterium]|nr:TetR/AcrR family transcriptional regulator [Actinomycetota bacterium]
MTSHDNTNDSTAAASTAKPGARIVHAALELIAERGLGGVTMSAIAETAGVARQTLYNHFPDIDSIVGTVIESHQAENINHLTALLSTVDSPADRLEHIIRQVAATSAHHHPGLNVHHGLSASMQELIGRYDHSIRDLIESTLRDGHDRGDFREDLDPARDATLVQRMIDGVGELVAAAPEDAAEIVTTAARTVNAAVASRDQA